MRRIENVQEEAMKLIWFVSLTFAVFIDMISFLSEQNQEGQRCWDGSAG